MKEKIEQEVANSLNKEFGTNTAQLLSDNSILQFVKLWIPTGCFAADLSMGTPGIPVGRITEICGDVAVGKTLLGLSVLAQTQKLGGVAIMIDFENALDPTLAELVHLNLEKCVLIQPPYMEKSFEQILKAIEFVKTKNKDVPVTMLFDSLAAAPMKVEVESGFEDMNIGSKAKFLSLSLRKITSLISQEKISLIFINQIRSKIGVMFGPKWTTPGGYALPFHASIRLLLSKSGELKDNKGKVKGIGSKIVCIKNKLAPPYKRYSTDIVFDKGFNNAKTFTEYLLEKDIVSRKGGWCYYKEKTLRGEDLIKLLSSDKEFKKDVEEKLRYKIPAYLLTGEIT